MYDEPPIQPGDTRPTMTVPALQDDSAPHGGSRIVGMLSLLGAVIFAAATIVLLLTSNGGTPPTEQDTGDDTVAEVLPTQTPTQPEPTSEAQPEATSAPEIVFVPMQAVPTIDAPNLAALLGQVPQAVNAGNPYVISRDALNPFTVIPDRPRNQIIEYVIQRGDTVSDIALRFGLQQDSIAWANDQQKLWTLVPGSVLLIPPVDGVIHNVVGDDTLAEIAQIYSVNDPYLIINSEFNQLKGYLPDMKLPSGLKVFVPGGIGLYIDWSPPVLIGTSGSGSNGSSSGSGLVSFPAGPGACAPQEPGPSSAWQRPLNDYRITRGYTDWHTGIDLAASEGAPVMAANTGRVIFAGWSTWGYGYAVVLSHGPYQSLYGHLSAVNVGCGQVVGAGQVIGAVGSTGNSSGPHLHFEIMYGGVRGNPGATIGF